MLCMVRFTKNFCQRFTWPGEGFEGGWADSLFRKLCVGRRLFKGRNLYVSGACLMTREMAEEKAVRRLSSVR